MKTMFNSKEPKIHVSSRPSGSPRKLFADYPYPILTELDKIDEQRQRRASTSSKFKFSRWYKDNFRKLVGLSQERARDNTSKTIVERSLRQTQLNEHPLQAITIDSPIRIETNSSSSISSPWNIAERANHVEDIQSISFEI